jgi:hypothetical protein
VDFGVLDADPPQTAGDHAPQRLSRGPRRSSFPPNVDPSHLLAASC